MEPALKAGRIVIVQKKPRKVGHDDVIIFRHGGIEKIKRIKLLYSDKNFRAKDIFVLGDNAKKSIDSRHFGLVSVDSVVGKVLWPKTS